MQQDTTDTPRPFHPISQPPHTAGQRYNGLRSAIDPRQIPSAIESAEADQAIWSNENFKTCDTQRTIPLSQSDYNALDQGGQMYAITDDRHGNLQTRRKLITAFRTGMYLCHTQHV